MHPGQLQDEGRERHKARKAEGYKNEKKVAEQAKPSPVRKAMDEKNESELQAKAEYEVKKVVMAEAKAKAEAEAKAKAEGRPVFQSRGTAEAKE